MGYYGNGFAFTAEPSWSAIARVFPRSTGLRAYRHRAYPIWLLDTWRASPREHWPFTDRKPEELVLPPRLHQDADTVLTAVSSVFRALSEARTYDLAWLRIAAQISLLAGTDTFFFAADDDLTDMACMAGGGGFVRFRLAVGGCVVEYDAGHLAVTPLDFAEDPEQNVPPATLSRLSCVPGVVVAPPRVVEGGKPLYENAVLLWPSGDPGAILGVGTWDPFEHVERDLRIVFEQLPVAAK
jgi:hypothetical protein